MSKEAKKCTQCGEIRGIEMFRHYYGNRSGTYRYCKICERINNREQYLQDKATREVLNDEELNTLNMIHELWSRQRVRGLIPPHTERITSQVSTDLEIKQQLIATAALASSIEIPEVPNVIVVQDLLKWLTCPLTKSPDYYNEVYDEDLRKRFRPMIKLGEDSLPVYDDTYKDILDKILVRFADYEDNYDWDSEEE